MERSSQISTSRAAGAALRKEAITARSSLRSSRARASVASPPRHGQEPQPLRVPGGAGLAQVVGEPPRGARARRRWLAIPLAAAVETVGAVVGGDVALSHVVVRADPRLRPGAP
eukprot:scaffold18813_cov55-Phaeocystis_antarctica.AAC.5